MRHTLLVIAPAAGLVLAGGCGAPSDPDAGAQDAVVLHDAQAFDAHALDAATLDAHALDAHTLDAHALDTDPTLDAPDQDADPAADASLDAAWPPLEEGELRPGGDTTTSIVGVGAFVQEAANLRLARRAEFEAGLQFFQLPWEIAPGRPEADGLGPLFHTDTCLGCHARNGRGTPSRTPADSAPGVLLRLGFADGSPDPVYGDQFQIRGIAGVPREGHAARTETPVEHVLADGSRASLWQASYTVTSLGYGPLAPGIVLSPRIGQQLVGQGLLEAIRDADLLALADPDDTNGDGISGRVHRLEDGSIGRFGWKATQPNVRLQVAAAFVGDLGITSSARPEESCTASQLACAGAVNGGSPELSATRLTTVAAYVRLLAVPARRDAETAPVRRGSALFREVGCAHCHQPSFVTGDALEPELSAQRIWPYTDLLLHDMGERLSDGRADGDASATEWRTAPLWGVGLLELVSGETRLLHDGRAHGVHEAILWHGGEADPARRAYERLSPDARDALVAFVESL